MKANNDKLIIKKLCCLNLKILELALVKKTTSINYASEAQNHTQLTNTQMKLGTDAGLQIQNLKSFRQSLSLLIDWQPLARCFNAESVKLCK